MRTASLLGLSVVVATWLGGMSGCGQQQAAVPNHSAAHHHDVEGPHGGHIIELGSPDFHAELTHDDDTHKVGVYMLDGSAKEPAPIAAESVTINVAIEGANTPYELPAMPQEGESPGTSSYFELESEPLCDIVGGHSDVENATARISIPIDGKPFVGIIETGSHDHDHDHGHAH